jgi:hypothetical protein
LQPPTHQSTITSTTTVTSTASTSSNRTVLPPWPSGVSWRPERPQTSTPKAEGKDNFAGDPPNATLSVYEPGQPDNTLVVVELSHPAIEGDDLVYTYKLLDGTMPKSGGATSLFIDAIGIEGGVGVGFHGVGVGLRGPGVL